MTRFIETEDGCFLNLNTVRKLRPRSTKYGPDELIAVTDDGETHLCNATAEIAERALWPVIPAQPGFILLRVWFGFGPVPDDVATDVVRDFIIGWRMTGYGPEPVTVESEVSGGDIRAILYPDGRIIMPEDQTFDSFETFLAHVRSQWQRNVEQRAKEAAAA